MRFRSLTEHLDYWANQAPERVFLSTADQRFTYSETATEVGRRAQAVASESEGQPVIITGNNSADWVLHLLAVFKSGLPAVLLPSAMPPHEAKVFTDLCGSRLQIEGKDCRRFAQCPERARSDVFRSSGASLAFPTSGSSGASKFVLRSAESLVDEGERYLKLWTLTPDDTIIAVLPLCHAYALGAVLAGTLVSGCSLWTSQFVSHRTLTAEICSSKATILPLVRPIAQALALGESGKAISSYLRVAMVGATPIASHTANYFHARWGIWLSQNYGSAETGATLASFYPESIVCTGSPLSHVECTLVPDSNERGHLWVKMQSSPLGYLTEQGWDCTKLSPGGWWPTGDLFIRDMKGNFVFNERIGGGIRRGGRNIQPREVEDALRDHPAVKEVCVTGATDIEGQERVEAYVQPQLGSSPSVSELREHLRSRVSEYKIPTHWTFINDMPLTWSGKVALQSISNRDHAPAATDGTRQLMSSRISEALLVAENVGLIERLASSEASVEMLAEELALDPLVLRIFLKFLENAGLVRQTNELWSIAFIPPRDWQRICSLERELRQSWLSAPVLNQVLKAGLKARDFDKGFASQEFASAYSNAVCGPVLKLSVQHLLRILKLPVTARVAEIGRGVGCLHEALSSHTGTTRIIPMGPPPAIVYPGFEKTNGAGRLDVMCWEQIKLLPSEFDLIVLLNCVHWITPEEFHNVFEILRNGLAPGGTLAVLDLFLASEKQEHGDTEFSSLFLLDWITHGGCFWLTTTEFIAQLGDSGFERIETRSFPNLKQRWVLAHPQQRRCADKSPTVERLRFLHQGA